MRYFTSAIVLLGAMLATTVNLSAAPSYFRAAGKVIVLADSMMAAEKTLIPDEYTSSLTSFDLSARLGKASGLTSEDYLKAAAADVRDWPADEAQKVEELFGMFSASLAKQRLMPNLPDTIIMIKTTGQSEFGAEGWTRQNRIMLNTSQQPLSLHLLAHELFHVMSRNDVQFRNAAYAIFNFKPCNTVTYKATMGNRVITNPDCPFIAHYVTIDISGKPTDVAIVLYSNSDYEPGYDFGQHAAVGLLALSGDKQHKQPVLKDGKAVVYELNEQSDLFNKIGRNTQYILHIEEVCAEHFAAAISGRLFEQPELVEQMRDVLRKN